MTTKKKPAPKVPTLPARLKQTAKKPRLVAVYVPATESTVQGHIYSQGFHLAHLQDMLHAMLRYANDQYEAKTGARPFLAIRSTTELAQVLPQQQPAKKPKKRAVARLRA